MEIGAKVKKARENKGLSQEKMAEMLNISQSKYSRFESNSTFLDWDKIPVLADALDLKITDLISNDKNIFYIHKPNNQSGYIENQTISNTDNLNKVVELYEKVIQEKEEIISLLKSRIM
ncbi:helix-turn-helix domain-containing protein [Flavobacterium sp.]|uniref:helix-turn-helix domain-containing protein n=1 Tax=Flavobacterium sp. TaxID=239 RepID=UPI00374DC0DB